jgi:hypothetical protein
MRSVVASVKAVVFVTFFCASSIFCYLLLLVYAFAAYALVGLAFVIIFGLVITVFPSLQPRDGIPFDLFLLVSALINFFLLGAFAIGTLFTFVLSPFRISRAIASSLSDTSVEVQDLVARTAEALKVQPFTSVIACSEFYVGVLKVGTRSVLCIDPEIIDAVGADKAASILAHEYGHLQPGRSISYGFIRRSLISVNFLRSQLLASDDKTTFRRAVRIATALFPPVLKEGSRSVSYHLGRVVFKFHDVWIKVLTAIYRDEFHDAEYDADALAHTAFGEKFPMALIEVAILQYINRSRQLGRAEDRILADWPKVYRSSSASHPSIEDRLKRMVADKLINAEVQRELMFGRLRWSEFKPKAQISIPLLQSLCFDEFQIVSEQDG